MKIIYSSIFAALFAINASAMESNPPSTMPATQSVFYMPLITWAYHVADMKTAEMSPFTRANTNALNEPLGMVMSIIGSESSRQILSGMIKAIIRHLQVDGNLLALGQAYLADQYPILGPGHIPGDMQVQILANSILDQETIDLINNHTDAGRQLDEDLRPAFDNVEAYMSLFIQSYYRFELLPMTVLFGSVDAGFESTHLANQPVRCNGTNVLNQFKLSSNNGRFQFGYVCSTQGLTNESVHRRHTEWNDEGGGNVVYFDRHDVSCDAHEAITGFELVREMKGSTPTGRFRFEYGCRNTNLGPLTTHYTGFNDDGQGKTIYLERHDVKCPGNTFLNAFKLVRSDNQNEYQFVYKCGSTRH